VFSLDIKDASESAAVTMFGRVPVSRSSAVESSSGESVLCNNMDRSGTEQSEQSMTNIVV